jgi:hypothetical protein
MNVDFPEGGQVQEAFAIIGATMGAHPTKPNALSFQKNNLRQSA